MLPTPTDRPVHTGVTTTCRIAGRLAATLLVAVTLLALVGTAPVLEAEAAGQRPHSTPHVVLALGDSVSAGTACGCRAFPSEYGALLNRRTGSPVTVDNESVSGLDTAGMLAQLQQPPIEAAVRRADVFLVTIGANDFADHHDRVVEGYCAVGTTSDCVGDEMWTMRTHLAEALAEIRTLRAGLPATVLVTGYWNVFEDGQVAQQASGTHGLQASIQLTRRVNDAISSVAGSAGGALRRPLRAVPATGWRHRCAAGP